MLITRETDYALRILRALSCGLQKNIPTICREEDIPNQFAYKILKKLSNARLVAITRGVAGGCRLIADPQKVTLLDLLDAMEEERLVNACLRHGFTCPRNTNVEGGCTVHCHLRRLQDDLEQNLRSLTLGQLFNP